MLFTPCGQGLSPRAAAARPPRRRIDAEKRQLFRRLRQCPPGSTSGVSMPAAMTAPLRLFAALRGAAVAWVLVLAGSTVQADCPDDTPSAERSLPPEQVRTQLRTLVQRAIDQSPQAGATRLLAEAAQDDSAEARAARAPQ